MTVIEFESGLVAQTHDAFTTRFAQTGLEIHGTLGSLIATDCMTQKPIGEVLLRDNEGETPLQIDRSNLYEVGIGAFNMAVVGLGAPASTGLDGLWSLTTALAALESARTGRRMNVEI